MSGVTKQLFALLLLPLCAGCAARRSPVFMGRASHSFSASLRITLSLKGRTLTFHGGCAVASSGDTRIELRDAMGTTRLLIFLRGARATAILPESGASYSWLRGVREFPWSAAQLRTLFVTGIPEGAKRHGDGSLSLSWRTYRGRVTMTRATGDKPTYAALRGPGSWRLAVAFSSVKAGNFGRDVFMPPRTLQLRPATAAEVFAGVAP